MQPTTQEARGVKNNPHESGEEMRQVKQHPLSRITSREKKKVALSSLGNVIESKRGRGNE